RLTRALNDFSRIVDQLDTHGVSFVSVTQQFNTTTSMGRLTLNMLLSFAQFEREVTAERISDKIAASKKKGLWMGGPPPLGYDNIDKKLVINKTEAATVRKLYNLYLELGTVRRLKDKADDLGIVTKRRKQRNGKLTGGRPFSRGNLYQLLSNPLYIAMVPHKGNTYPGQHKAIIDQVLWDDVQQNLSGNAVDRICGTNSKAPFLLTGKVFDETGDLLYQSQADKIGKRYRYYISRRLVHEAHRHDDGWRLPAKNLETIVISGIKELLGDTSQLMDELHPGQENLTDIKQLMVRSKHLLGMLADGEHAATLEFLQNVVDRVELSRNQVVITMSKKALVALLNDGHDLNDQVGDGKVVITVPVTLRRQGVEAKLVITGVNNNQSQPDKQLCQLLARARLWYDQLASAEIPSVRAIAKRDGVVESEVTRILPLAFLSPEIIESVLRGNQQDSMSVERLKRLSPLPGDWKSQDILIDNLR
ncbi:MAG: recombinase family protein, partial [Alphaproteobacteria bacterium]|nr:recombinase family protein [Alphaproteobacteria bacterium]